jgi:hypothetical protein
VASESKPDLSKRKTRAEISKRTNGTEVKPGNVADSQNSGEVDGSKGEEQDARVLARECLKVIGREMGVTR